MIKSKIEELFKFLTLILPISIGATFIYEVSFFWGIGIYQTPLGLADLFRGWVNWLGSLIYFLVVFITFILLLPWSIFARVLVSKDNLKKSEAITTRKIGIIEQLIYLILIIIFPMLYGAKMLPLAFFAIFGVLINITLIETRGYSKEKQRATMIFRVFFYFILVFYSYHGINDGNLALDKSFKSSSKLTFNSEEFKVVRLFDQWALVKGSDDQFSWIYHQSDRKIDAIPFIPERKFIGLIPYCALYENVKFCKMLNFD